MCKQVGNRNLQTLTTCKNIFKLENNWFNALLYYLGVYDASDELTRIIIQCILIGFKYIAMKKFLLSNLAVTMLLSITNLASAQAPTLGTAAGFVLFTTNGGLSNSGTSLLTGNVGTNNGAITGFGVINGAIHNADAASALCASDLLVAYNQLNAATPTIFPAPLLGNGQILTPGVYSISQASTLNAGLTLDAQNNPAAVFIIQIQGGLTSNAGAVVSLANGALACNVFWKVEGAVTLGTNTNMKGTIIANNAAIVINTGCMLEGRALTTTGAITVIGVQGSIPTGCLPTKTVLLLDRNSNMEITIFPNPFPRYTTVTIDDFSQDENYELVVLNSSGTKVLSIIINQQPFTLDASELHSGIYFYLLLNKNRVVNSGKLIVM